MGRSAPKDTLDEKIREIAQSPVRFRSKPLPRSLADVPDSVLAIWARTTLHNAAILGELSHEELNPENFIRSTLHSLDKAPWANDTFLGYSTVSMAIRKQLIAESLARRALQNGNHTRRAASPAMQELRDLLPKCGAIFSAAGFKQREAAKLFAKWISKVGKRADGENVLAVSGEAIRRDYLRGASYQRNWSQLDPKTGLPLNAFASGPETLVRDWLQDLMLNAKINKERFVDHAVELRDDLLNRYIRLRIEYTVARYVDEIEGDAQR